MTYLDKEGSIDDGQPVELFRFFNTEESFNYTNGQSEVVFNNQTYIPTVISRSDPDLQNVEANRNLTVRLAIDDPFALRYVNTVPASIDEFEIFRQHTTDTGVPETINFFAGKVSSVAFEGTKAIVNIQNFGSILQRLVPQQTTRNPCNHILYDSKCAVVDTNFAVSTIVTAISADGLLLTVDAGTNTVPDTGFQLSAQLTDDATFFTGGFLARASIELRMARAVVDDGGNVATITVLFPMQTIEVGASLVLFAGCDHKFPTCIAKFANADRYGGFPFIPLKNPFAVGVKGL